MPRLFFFFFFELDLLLVDELPICFVVVFLIVVSDLCRLSGERSFFTQLCLISSISRSLCFSCSYSSSSIKMLPSSDRKRSSPSSSPIISSLEFSSRVGISTKAFFGDFSCLCPASKLTWSRRIKISNSESLTNSIAYSTKSGGILFKFVMLILPSL